jgi:hypothetical protein
MAAAPSCAQRPANVPPSGDPGFATELPLKPKGTPSTSLSSPPTPTPSPRSCEGKGRHEAVEVEALGQGTVVAIIRDALDDLLPEPLDRVQVREQEQRAQVKQALDELT